MLKNKKIIIMINTHLSWLHMPLSMVDSCCVRHAHHLELSAHHLELSAHHLELSTHLYKHYTTHLLGSNDMNF